MWNSITILHIGRIAVKVFEAGVVSELLLLQHNATRMALLGLVVDLADLNCHIDVIGGRLLLVGFDSGLQCFSTRQYNDMFGTDVRFAHTTTQCD